MKRLSAAIFASLVLVLVLPAGSLATLTEVGVLPRRPRRPYPAAPAPRAWPSVAQPAFRSRSRRTTIRSPRLASGTVVAWTITLGTPSAAQTKFFNEHEGGAAEAGIADSARPSQAQPDLQADRAEPAGQAAALFRQDRAVCAGNDAGGQEGRHRRADRAHMGARARPGLRQGHIVAGEQAQGAVLEHEHPDRPDADSHLDAVLLPLSDGPPDLQRDADLHPVI